MKTVFILFLSTLTCCQLLKMNPQLEKDLEKVAEDAVDLKLPEPEPRPESKGPLGIAEDEPTQEELC